MGISTGVRAPLPTRPTPLPNRPKGRLFISLLLLAVGGFGAYSAWDAFFRYQAYGVVTGRVIEVSAPWPGIVRQLHVREGSVVRQGDLLVTIENVERDQRLSRLSDELRVAQSTLDARISQLQLQAELRGDRGQKALADYYQLWGELLLEKAELDKRQADLQRLVDLSELGHGTPQALDAARFAEAGQRAKVEKLSVAVDELKKRVELTPADNELMSAELKPHLARIELIQADLGRLRQQVEQGTVRSPVNGRVLKTLRFAGEYADPSQGVIEILEDDSLETVLYVPQKDSESIKVGQTLDVCIVPSSESVTCQVAKFGEYLENPPDNLKRYYRNNEKLLPVHLLPADRRGRSDEWRLGSVVKLPYKWIGS